jgi:hypothetical protein
MGKRGLNVLLCLQQSVGLLHKVRAASTWGAMGKYGLNVLLCLQQSVGLFA